MKRKRGTKNDWPLFVFQTFCVAGKNEMLCWCQVNEISKQVNICFVASNNTVNSWCCAVLSVSKLEPIELYSLGIDFYLTKTWSHSEKHLSLSLSICSKCEPKSVDAFVMTFEAIMFFFSHLTFGFTSRCQALLSTKTLNFKYGYTIYFIRKLTNRIINTFDLHTNGLYSLDQEHFGHKSNVSFENCEFASVHESECL